MAHSLFSYWVELRDTGTYGFMLPSEYILPSGEETLAGILHVGDFIDEWLHD
jgi:extracellular matrix protein 14